MPKKRTIFRDDPHGNKEDTRPVERRKKPRFSMEWSKMKELLNLE